MSYTLKPTEECDAEYTEYLVYKESKYLGSVCKYTNETKWYFYNSKEEELGKYVLLGGAISKVAGV